MGKRIIVIICLFMGIAAQKATAALVYNGDGTVTDTVTCLMWQQVTQDEMSWNSAKAYCESLVLAGHDDWRLPSRGELWSIVDSSSSSSPCFDTTVFDTFDTIGYSYSYLSYWSSTFEPSDYGLNKMWWVWYNYWEGQCGDDSASVGNGDEDKNYVRAVRTIQSGPSGNLAVGINNPSSAITISSGDSVNFAGTVSNGFAPYIYWWDFAGIGGSALEDPGAFTFTWPGTYPIVFYVQDNQGTLASDTVTVTVIPSVDSLKADIDPLLTNTTITVGEALTFTGSASGGSGVYTYWWDFPGIGGSALEDPGDIPFAWEGTYQVVLWVKDSLGTLVYDTATITVIPHKDSLKADIDTPLPNTTITAGEALTFTGSASGGSGVYTYWWEVDTIGTSPLEDPEPITFYTVGTYSIIFYVRDSLGAVHYDSLLIYVNAPNVN